MMRAFNTVRRSPAEKLRTGARHAGTVVPVVAIRIEHNSIRTIPMKRERAQAAVVRMSKDDIKNGISGLSTRTINQGSVIKRLNRALAPQEMGITKLLVPGFQLAKIWHRQTPGLG
jgi:hypothetical protein